MTLRGLIFGILFGALLGCGLGLIQYFQIQGGAPYHDATTGTYYFATLLGAPISFLGYALGDALWPAPIPDAAVWILLTLNWGVVGALAGWILSRRGHRDPQVPPPIGSNGGS